MPAIPFTGNYDDLSTDRGYQFKFYCEKCHNGYMSSFQTSKMGMLGSAALLAALAIKLPLLGNYAIWRGKLWPLLLLWMGIDEAPKITLIVLGSVFFNLLMETINSFQVFTSAYVVGGPNGQPAGSTLFYTIYLFDRGFGDCPGACIWTKGCGRKSIETLPTP